MEEGLDSSYQLTPAASVLHPTWISVISARVMRTLTETYGTSHRPIAQGPVPGGAAPELILTSDLVLPWHPLCGPSQPSTLYRCTLPSVRLPNPVGRLFLYTLICVIPLFSLVSASGEGRATIMTAVTVLCLEFILMAWSQKFLNGQRRQAPAFLFLSPMAVLPSEA